MARDKWRHVEDWAYATLGFIVFNWKEWRIMNEFYDFILNECESFQMKIFDYLSIRISRDQFGAFREISFCIKKTRPLHSLMFS